MDNDKDDYFDKLAAGFAHEVKNPVSLIRANIDLLSLDDDSGRYTANYELIKRQLDRINSIVTDFIELSKTDENNKEKIFIYDLVNDIINEYDISIKQKDITFSVNCDDENISLFGNYSKLCILFFNMFKNAVEAIDEKGHIICNLSSSGKSIIAEVIDDGTGIDEKIKDKIGKPFITTKKGGSGLGLIICQNIAQSHNGKFELIGNSGKGCTARVTLLSE